MTSRDASPLGDLLGPIFRGLYSVARSAGFEDLIEKIDKLSAADGNMPAGQGRAPREDQASMQGGKNPILPDSEWPAQRSPSPSSGSKAARP